jgi:hypothetical protein
LRIISAIAATLCCALARVHRVKLNLFLPFLSVLALLLLIALAASWFYSLL